jgi:hypothetical protein
MLVLSSWCVLSTKALAASRLVAKLALLEPLLLGGMFDCLLHECALLPAGSFRDFEVQLQDKAHKAICRT